MTNRYNQSLNTKVVRGWKDGAHPMCTILLNGGTVQQCGIGDRGDFLYFQFLIPTSPQYITRVFFVPYPEKPP
jgi:hypothetical protein